MSAFSKAVTELVIAATAPSAWDRTQEAARAVNDFIPTLAREQLNEGLIRLLDPLATADIPSAGLIALCCGAMVEAGGNAHITIDAVADRLPETMSLASKFVEACARAAENATPPPDDAAESFAADPVADFGDHVRRYVPEAANAFYALDPLGLGAIAMMSPSPGLRARVRERHPQLLEQALALQPYHARAPFLATMLRVLDHEPLLAIHPGMRRGYLLDMHGIATNVELFILLADVLVGDPAKGWLPGRKPDPRAAAACRNHPVVPGADTVVGAFNVWNWTGLQAGGTLPEGNQMAGAEHWVWMEGVPADILTFEGKRVVLLGPPPYARIMQAGRCFRDMPADLRVARVLPTGEVEDWLRRISSTPRPRIV